jgi:uncharacterized protein (DUF39 family)
MKRCLTAVAALVLGLAACLTVVIFSSAPASATISFCQTGKNSPCISPINGCSLVLGNGRYIFANNGDSVIAGDGSKHICINGRWIKTAALGSDVQSGSTLGRGVFVQGPPGPITLPDCDVLLTCPIG